MSSITDLLARVGDVATPLALPAVGSLRDQELLDGQRVVAEVQRRLSAINAAFAGEIAHRSRRELGHDGLAQSNGQRTAEGLISQLTGGSTREARTLVKAGELLPTAAPRAEAPPLARWLTIIGDAVSRATISVEAAEVIRTRLGATLRTNPGADASLLDGTGDSATSTEADPALLDALAAAATRLVADATGLTLERLAERASRVRDELDAAGVAAREEQLREKRFLHVTRLADGSAAFRGLFDPESAAIVLPIFDATTSPRRGGPRFVDPDAAERADDIVRDERTTDQLTLDTFVDLLRAGARVDPGKLLGDRKPAVRILVTAADLSATPEPDGHRAGAAYFEGQTEPVSIATAERFICSSGAVPILFDDDGRALNLGREQRLFSEKQRIALAARDGGCLMCDRPPSWSEVDLPGFDGHRDSGRGVAGRCSHGAGVLAGVQGSDRRVASTGSHVQGPEPGVRSVGDDSFELGAGRRQEEGRVAA